MNALRLGMVMTVLASMHSLFAQELIIRNTPLESGTIRSGERVGIWSYSDYPGELGLVINYDTKEILFMAPDSSEFIVEEGGLWKSERLLRPCRLHGPRSLILQHYKSQVTVHPELRSRARRKQTAIVTMITFDVGPSGTASNPVVSGYKGFGMEKMLLSAFQSAPNIWIPGVKADGTLVTCRFGITITICPEDEVGNLMGQTQNKNTINNLIGPCAGATPEPDSVKVLYNFNPGELGSQDYSQNQTRASTQKDSQYTGMIGKTSTTGAATFSMSAVQPYHPFASVSPMAHDTKNSYEVPTTSTRSLRPPSPKDPWSNESSGIQFSPNGEQIAVDASLLARSANGLLVMSTDGTEFSKIEYGAIMNAYWLDDFNVAFKYKYGSTQPIHALYDRSTKVIAMRKDSITYFDRISPDLSMVCLASRHGNGNRISIVNLVTLEKEVVLVDESLRAFPVSWSPDQKAIIMMGNKEDYFVLIHYDLKKQKPRLLPIVNAEPCGWSTDGATLYAMRINERNGELFSMNTQSMVVDEFSGKVSGLRYAEFSHKANKFMLLMKGGLYLLDPEKPFNPSAIVKNVSFAKWSPDGKQIAYVSERGALLSLYEISSGRSKILINQLVAKK